MVMPDISRKRMRFVQRNPASFAHGKACLIDERPFGQDSWTSCRFHDSFIRIGCATKGSKKWGDSDNGWSRRLSRWSCVDLPRRSDGFYLPVPCHRGSVTRSYCSGRLSILEGYFRCCAPPRFSKRRILGSSLWDVRITERYLPE